MHLPLTRSPPSKPLPIQQWGRRLFGAKAAESTTATDAAKAQAGAKAEEQFGKGWGGVPYGGYGKGGYPYGGYGKGGGYPYGGGGNSFASASASATASSGGVS
jgi:hypothetical protein